MDFHSPLLMCDMKKARRNLKIGNTTLLTKTRLIICVIIVLGVVLLSHLSIASASNVTSVVICTAGTTTPCATSTTAHGEHATQQLGIEEAVSRHHAARTSHSVITKMSAGHAAKTTKTDALHQQARHAQTQGIAAGASSVHTPVNAHVQADATTGEAQSASTIHKQRTTTTHHKHPHKEHKAHHNIRLPAWAWGVGGLALGSVATAIFAAATAPPQVPLTPTDDLEYLMSFQRPMPKRGPTFEELAPPTPIASPNSRSWSGVVRERSVV